VIFLTVTAVKMQKSLKYTIFRTKWGYFGLAGVENTLLRTCLPLSEPEKVKLELLKSRLVVVLKSRIECDKNLFKTLQEQIIAYFEGVCINFSRDIPIALDGFGSFTRSVLTACRNIKFGQTLTYSALAKKLGRPDAMRAVGNALAKNPLPLIIPCHRVIRSDGAIGGFSAPGGTNLKAKMLKHENSVLID
jgi:methylated-DNA-[protein]-cysteine S-methyltransferase